MAETTSQELNQLSHKSDGDVMNYKRENKKLNNINNKMMSIDRRLKI